MKSFATLAVCAMLVSGSVWADELPFTVSTHGGLTIQAKDGSSKASISGRLMWDTDIYSGFYNQPGDGRTGSETELRRARLAASGVVDHDWAFEFSINVADAKREATINSAFIAYTGWDWATLHTGRFKRPFGLEHLGSSNWTSTIERASIWDVIPAVNTADFGVMLSGMQGPFTWAAGLFDDGNEDSATDRDRYGVNARVTFANLSMDGNVIHVGLAYGNQLIGAGTPTRVRTRAGAHTIDPVTLLDAYPANGDFQVGLEAAWLRGPFSLQAEWVSRRLSGQGVEDVKIDGSYVQATWTLTGESRSYSGKSASFGRVKLQGAKSAFELVAKAELSTVQQVDAEPTKDVVVFTLGGTWWVNRSVRVMLNLAHVDTDNVNEGGPGGTDGSVISTRLQYSF